MSKQVGSQSGQYSLCDILGTFWGNVANQGPRARHFLFAQAVHISRAPIRCPGKTETWPLSELLLQAPFLCRLEEPHCWQASSPKCFWPKSVTAALGTSGIMSLPQTWQEQSSLLFFSLHSSWKAF